MSIPGSKNCVEWLEASRSMSVGQIGHFSESLRLASVLQCKAINEQVEVTILAAGSGDD
jgi:uncharacterized protein (DUF58 family)